MRRREPLLGPIGGVTRGGCPCGFWSRYVCAYTRLHWICTFRPPFVPDRDTHTERED